VSCDEHRAGALSDPIALPCGQVLANRLVKTAMSEQLADRRNAPTVGHRRLFARWGASGVGLMVSGNVSVHRGHLSEPGNVVIEDDRDLDKLRSWAQAANGNGARVWLQINHPGRQALALAGGKRPVAPSPVAPKVLGSPKPRALEVSQIEEIVGRFAAAAAVVKQAGFDGVQLHGCHGMLISQFLSPLTNRRDDEWGGDPERRMRFLVEVLRSVRSAVGPGPEFAVGIKLNSADFQRGGFTEDECELVIERLVAEGIDLVEISGGNIESLAFMDGGEQERTHEREAYFLEFAARMSGRTGDVPLAVTGGFRTLATMEKSVADGACDLVGLGRPSAPRPMSRPSCLAANASASSRATFTPAPGRCWRSFWGRASRRARSTRTGTPTSCTESPPEKTRISIGHAGVPRSPASVATAGGRFAGAGPRADRSGYMSLALIL
jgi:2,4-dienoyl-CoA reductase-like NADH-dependent reductase (Old Yellow Enzyme family)